MNPLTTLLDAAILAAEQGDRDRIERIQDLMLDTNRTASVMEQAGQLLEMEGTGTQPDTFRQ